MSGGQLPLFARGRGKIGRHRRQLDALARDIRKTGRDVYVDALIDAARLHADAADGLEADPDGSIHTLTMVGGHYRQALAELAPYANSSSGEDPLANALAAALRNSA